MALNIGGIAGANMSQAIGQTVYLILVMWYQNFMLIVSSVE
jgi:hypothetical protein